MRSRILLLLALGCSLSVSSPAVALPSPPDKKVSRKADAHARRLYEKGNRAYAEGRYEEAVKEFEKAYALSGRPLLLFNLGNAYERLERFSDAADALDHYLPDAKPGEQNAIEDRIASLKRRAKKKAAEKEKEEREKQAAEAKAAPKPAVPSRKPERHPAPGAQGSPPTLGYVLLGTGGAALVVGGVFGALALSARHDETSNCASTGGKRLCTTDANSAISRDQRYSLAADIGFGVGVVAAGVGVYLMLGSHSHKEKTASQSHFTSALGARPRPGGGELDLVGRF